MKCKYKLKDQSKKDLKGALLKLTLMVIGLVIATLVGWGLDYFFPNFLGIPELSGVVYYMSTGLVVIGYAGSVVVGLLLIWWFITNTFENNFEKCEEDE